MSDRITEIRARLEIAQNNRLLWPDHKPGTLAEFIAHAPADIAWLLAEVERLRRRAWCPACGAESANSPCVECWHDDSVVQGVTEWERSDAK